MKKSYCLMFIGLIIFIHQTIDAHNTKPSIMRQACCYVFGNKDASEEIKSYFSDAAKHFSLPHNNQYPIKYIHPYPYIVLNFGFQQKLELHFLDTLASFTRIGTWINKEYWESIDHNEKEWCAYHETAHTVLNHTQKEILVALFSALTTFSLTKMALKFNMLGSTIITAGALSLIIPFYAQKCEQEANNAAAQILCAVNKRDVVQQQIAKLSQQKYFSLWFKSSAQQKIALEKILSQTNTSRTV